MQKSKQNIEIDLDSISVSPHSYDNLVKGAISQEYDKFWTNNRNILIFRNKPLEEIFSVIIKDTQFNTFSRHIQLSESLESLSGLFISGKIRILRGFLLNLEKTSLYFYLFKRIGEIYNIKPLIDISNEGLNTNHFIFSELWGDSYPQEIIRPGHTKTVNNPKNLQKTQKMLGNQQKLLMSIRKSIKSSEILVDRLNTFSNLTHKEILDSGLTGPIARSVNIVSPLLNLSPSINRFSSSRFSQYATSQNSKPQDLLEICNVELKLALGRMITLLPNILGTIKSSEHKLKNGEISSSFPISLGINHLSVGIDEGHIKYFKFIPFATTNLLGISRLLAKNSTEVYPFILLFLNPEMEFQVDQE